MKCFSGGILWNSTFDKSPRTTAGSGHWTACLWIFREAALQNVTLDLEPGTIALLGPNGSGKTTLLRCLATLTKPDRGQVWFDGYPYSKNLKRLRGQLGYLPQDPDLPAGLTPRRFLEYLATLKDLTGAGQVDRPLAALGLEQIADRPFARLSGGQIRLAGVAQAFLGRPSLLLLDELTRGLDVAERERVFALVRKPALCVGAGGVEGPAPERLVLFSTHLPLDAGRLVRQVIVLRRGEVLFWGDVEHLRRLAQGAVYQVAVPAGEEIQGYVTARQKAAFGGKTMLRVVGPCPYGYPTISVEPTLEEAYLWLLHKDP